MFVRLLPATVCARHQTRHTRILVRVQVLRTQSTGKAHKGRGLQFSSKRGGKDKMIFRHDPIDNPRITSRFGKRNTGIAGASTNHKGIDFGGVKGAPLYAVDSGVVYKNYWNKVRGWVVIIQHDKTYMTLYQHLAEQSPLKVNTRVNAGDIIGKCGNTSATLKIASHLHLELWRDNVPIDFEEYLKGDIGTMNEKELRQIVREELTSVLAGNGDTPSKWAAEIWDNATRNGITDGTKPQGYCTREQVITMIARATK